MKRRKTEEIISVEAGAQLRTLRRARAPVLTLRLRWPVLPEDTAAHRRIGRYYRKMVQMWQARWERDLYRRACAAYEDALEAGLPFRPWEAELDFFVTCHERGLLSLYWDACEYGGGSAPLTVRFGDTWDWNTGAPQGLAAFCPRRHWRKVLLPAVTAQAEALLATGEVLYYDDWRQRITSEFDPSCFYLTPQGVTLFYQTYALAPYVEGIPTFLVELHNGICEK